MLTGPPRATPHGVTCKRSFVLIVFILLCSIPGIASERTIDNSALFPCVVETIPYILDLTLPIQLELRITHLSIQTALAGSGGGGGGV